MQLSPDEVKYLIEVLNRPHIRHVEKDSPDIQGKRHRKLLQKLEDLDQRLHRK